MGEVAVEKYKELQPGFDYYGYYHACHGQGITAIKR